MDDKSELGDFQTNLCTLSEPTECDFSDERL